jgi:predicted DNA-binding helix-hairpin-helix protein
MQITHTPDARERIEQLSELAALDCDGEPMLTSPQSAKAGFLARSVVQVQRPDGPMTVLRTVQTSACERNCYYCAFRAGRGGFRRLSLRPDELARGFDAMQRARVVSGLFLSSGIAGSGVKTMDSMLATVELLRQKYRYRGYIHLKILPGAEAAQIEQAMRLADRVSINLEGANARRLGSIAPQKDFERELLSAMHQVRQVAGVQGLYARVPSLVTQFVVGPAGESDQELLTTASQLYRDVHLSRAYYSGFSPIPDTPLSGLPATPPVREHRLYQADWLLRFYGFVLEELPFEPGGALPAGTDPKLAWARRHLAGRPVEVNRCSRSDLLRVPGIGPRTADTLLHARRDGRLHDLADLRALGVAVNRAAPFVLLDGRRPAYQLGFWESLG